MSVTRRVDTGRTVLEYETGLTGMRQLVDVPLVGELPGKPKRKKTGGVSPNARTLRLYREAGYLCDVVERYDHHAQRLHDFLGMFDIIAVGRREVLGLQPTTRANVAARVKKIRSSPLYAPWLGTGAKAVVVGWGRLNGQWSCDETELTLATHPPLKNDPFQEDER